MFQMLSEVNIHGSCLNAGDPGDILPVLCLQLPQDKVMPQINEPNASLPSGVQCHPGKAGNRLWLQRLLIPV